MTDAHNDPGGVDDKPSEPTTGSGRGLLSVRLAHLPCCAVFISGDLRLDGGYACGCNLDDTIVAIEQEARADERRIITDALGSYMEAVDLLRERDELRTELVRLHDIAHIGLVGTHQAGSRPATCHTCRVLSKSEEQEGG